MKFALFIIVCVFGLVLIRDNFSPSSNSKNLIIEKNNETVEYYFNGIINRKFNDEGELSVQMKSIHAEKILNQKQLNISQPMLQLQTPLNRWNIKADSGQFNPKSQILVFNHQVELADDNLTTMVRTQQLNVDNKQQLIHNDLALSIQTEASTTTATGLVINLDSETIELLSDVKTEFLPPQSDSLTE